ncbi:helix-turn-helix domain-containing protein [Ligilactobacillus saerimneri]|uniref:SOS-response repressor and protease LexA n=1 Tax=Ligilactobacillus saerimneri 30a TaxID=1227363 RepID=M5J775_9LACO|nr:helix-turn-helix transcriptional regulator [Ligilactobacillus saerimneri]EKW99412.1 SOS-response repressor and protease LexA [Ligilactobacillus saerimneri 30a]
MRMGEKIKLRRKELGISADELADKLNVNRSTMFRYEKGDIEKVPVSFLKDVATILNVAPTYLMGWSDNESDISAAYNLSPNMSTYERIQKLAKSQGMSVRELGRKLDIGDTTIYKWKTQTPKVDVLEKVANYFNVSLDYLMGRESNIDTIHNVSIDTALDMVKTYKGKPISQHDKVVMKRILEAYLETRCK